MECKNNNNKQARNLACKPLTYLYDRSKSMKRTTWFTVLAIIAISCLSEPDCYQLNNFETGITFNVLGFGSDPDTLLYLYVTGTDSTFYKREAGPNFELPLNPRVNEITYAFLWLDGSQDTLMLRYSSQIQFVSPDCGQRYVFGNLSAVYSTFDSLRLVSPTPTAPSSTNFVVYRCADPDDTGIKFRTTKNGASVDSALTVTHIIPDFSDPVYEGETHPLFFLPLDKKKSSTSYNFVLEDGSSENLTLSYNRETRASIQDCDSVTFFTRIRIASTTFDTTSTKFNNISTTPVKSTGTRDPAIINFEIFL
jgi:hypothetical protein